MHQLDKIDPKFRLLVDQLFFTDRTDLDVSNFLILFDNKDEHYRYLWDRFVRGTEIFWEESFWVNRFDLLISLNPRRLADEIESFLISRFRNLIVYNYQASPKHDNHYIQFIAWIKAKSSRKDNLMPVRDLFINLPHTVESSRLLSIIQNFIPHLFQDVEEYLGCLSRDAAQSARHFEVLQQLEKQGVQFDKSPLFKLAISLIVKRAPNRKNRRSLFAMLNDPSIMAFLKLEYKNDYRTRLLDLIKKCEYREFEEYHFRNVKNLLELDESVADDLMTTYAGKLHGRRIGHKKANIQRLIRLCKAYPQCSPKKMLSYLSTHGRMSDIKYLLRAFPDLKTLAPFV